LNKKVDKNEKKNIIIVEHAFLANGSNLNKKGDRRVDLTDKFLSIFKQVCEIESKLEKVCSILRQLNLLNLASNSKIILTERALISSHLIISKLLNEVEFSISRLSGNVDNILIDVSTENSDRIAIKIQITPILYEINKLIEEGIKDDEQTDSKS